MDTKLKCVFEMPDNAPQVSEIPHLIPANDTATRTAHEAWAVLLLLALIPINSQGKPFPTTDKQNICELQKRKED